MIGDSLPIMNQVVANRYPASYSQSQCINPTTQRLTLENQYASMAQNMVQQPSNPYSDYLEVYNSCNSTVQNRIQEDSRYIDIYTQCQAALLHEAFSQVMPVVLSTQQGRILFEQLYNISKSLKEEYTQKDIQKEKQLEALMNDPVVMQRLMEIQSGRTIPQQQPQQQRVEPASSSAPTNSNHQNSKGNQQKYQQNKSQPGDTLE